MPIDRAVLDEQLAKLNRRRPADIPARLESYEPPGRFTLSFPNRAMPEGQCIDQDFTDIQFALHEENRIDTGIIAGRLHPEDGRYWMTYQVIEWD